MSDDLDNARAAVRNLWEQLDEMQQQLLVNTVARAVAAEATAKDLQEWLDLCLFGSE